MIRRELKIRLTELEKRYAAAVRAKDNEATAPKTLARWHATQVAAVFLYGKPRIDKPFSHAGFSVEENLKKEFATVAEDWISESGREIHPMILHRLAMVHALPGADERLKIERVFSKAPSWLLKFTAVEWDANLLGFKLPKLVGAPELGREARLDRNKWPFLPSRTIDAGGPCSDPDEPWESIVKRRCREISRSR